MAAPTGVTTTLLVDLVDYLGLIVFTLASGGLIVYLLYAMLRPERF